MTGRGHPVPRPESPGEVRGAAESPAGGDLGDGQVAQARIGQIVRAPAQPLLTDPAAEGQTLAGEDPVQLPDRDVARPGDGLR